MTQSSQTAKSGFGFAIKVSVTLTLCLSFWIYVSERYTLGIDDQKDRCLPYRFFLIDGWQRPSAADLERGEMIAVHLREAQRPANARWTTDTIMVKRAVASHPGTIARVRRDGITFQSGTETWTHGTALETAARLGHKVEDYERDYVLQPGQFFFMGDAPHTYDSRYYGPLDDTMITGRVVFAW